jgi:hypothetical protein
MTEIVPRSMPAKNERVNGGVHTGDTENNPLDEEKNCPTCNMPYKPNRTPCPRCGEGFPDFG